MFRIAIKHKANEFNKVLISIRASLFGVETRFWEQIYLTMSQCKNNNCCNNGKNSKVLLEERKEINVLYEWKWKCLTFNVIMTPNNYITFHPVYSAGTAVIRGDIPFLSNHHYFWEFQICNNIYGTDIVSY